MSPSENPRGLRVGDKVIKDGGDYTFEGTIVSKFRKKSGALRMVVEHDQHGMLHIFNPTQLRYVGASS